MKGLKYILIFCLLLFSISGYSQKWKLTRQEYSYGVGISNYFGDIGGASEEEKSGFSDFDFRYSRPILAVGYHYKLYERVAVKGNLTYANIHGSDAHSYLEARNNTFTNNMFELNGQVEYHITKDQQMVTYNKMSLRGKLNKFNVGLNVYVFVGIGGSFSMVKAKDNLVDDPRFDNSKKLALVFPVGIGVKYPLTPTTSVGLELGGRFTTSDYIDGFNTESSTSNDIYYFTVINVSTKIKRSKRRSQN